MEATAGELLIPEVAEMISGHTDLWGDRKSFLLIWSLTLHFMLVFRDDHYGSSDAGELKRICGFWLPDFKFFACKHL